MQITLSTYVISTTCNRRKQITATSTDCCVFLQSKTNRMARGGETRRPFCFLMLENVNCDAYLAGSLFI